MPRRINGFDREWTLKQITEFYDEASFMYTELCNLADEIDAELDFMSFDETCTPYGKELQEVGERLVGALGLAEDLTSELSDFRNFLK